MKYEKSCGAVVYTKTNGVIRYVLIRSLEGIWGFPKGHAEAGETEEETALREVYEEVRLKVTLQKGFRVADAHEIPGKNGVIKQVVYFCGEYDDQEIIPLQSELTGAVLVTYEEALPLFQFESSKRILKEANDFLGGSHDRTRK